MSHTTTVELEYTDEEALIQALDATGFPYQKNKTVQLYSSKHTGIAVNLPGWKYPIVLEKTDSGYRLRYDNYNGRWGDQKTLDSFMQKLARKYAEKVAQKYAKRLGGRITKKRDKKGSLIIEIEVPDSALKRLA